jgi:hypothetical protein
MEIFDNVTRIVKDDMSVEIKKGSKLSIAASCFSMYAYQALRGQLDSIDELRFIFTSPTFVKEKAQKSKREFYIPRINRERSLYGTEFEVKLRNELTQKAIAKECTDWIRKKVTFKSNVTNENMGGFINVIAADSALTYMPVNGFTTVDLGCDRGNNSYNMVTKMEAPHSHEFIRVFNSIWNDENKLQEVTEIVIDSITEAYKENTPNFIYFVTLYNIFNEFLEDISEDVLPNEATGFKESKIWNLLYDFQKDAVLTIINTFENNGSTVLDLVDLSETSDFDLDDQSTDFFTVGKKVKIDLVDMDYKSWREELVMDAETLELLSLMIADITPEHDTKLQTLFQLVADKLEKPINEANKKILIFTAFSDTAEYLYSHVSKHIKNSYGLDSAMITGSVDGKTTISKFRASLNNVLTCFSPVSKDKELLMPDSKDSIEILIATDCISEGQNLQDCDYVINYDIHWNPVRIIQRFGRIDRIGSRNDNIQLVNFWPDLPLDEYINLKSRVETRMRISVMTSTGDDDLINAEEKGDLEYRKQQLQRLQEEVVDIEDMSSGISIMDLGLNEFRLDLLEYVRNNPDLDKTPLGMHAIVPVTEDTPAGVIYVLKNINGGVNIDNQNRLHPFYMVYISNDGDVICDHLSPKELLDKLRFICRGISSPDEDLCSAFNKETKDGKDMKKYSELLGDAINSIIDVKEESDIDSLFRGGGTSALLSEVTGLDDFELICFLVIK